MNHRIFVRECPPELPPEQRCLGDPVTFSMWHYEAVYETDEPPASAEKQFPGITERYQATGKLWQCSQRYTNAHFALRALQTQLRLMDIEPPEPENL